MVSAGYEKLAAQYGFKKFQGVLYGPIQGYMVTLHEGIGYKAASVCVTFTRQNEQQQLLSELYSGEMSKRCRLQQVQYSAEGILLLNFLDNPGTNKKIAAFFDWFFPRLRASGARGMTHCSVCGQEFGQTPGPLKLFQNCVVPIHPGCAGSISRKSAETAEEFQDEQKHYGKGLLGAILGGVVGAIPWAVVYLLGYFAAIVGFFIGLAVKKGYELLGGQPGKGKFWIILVITLLAAALGQFLGDAVELGRLIADGELPLTTYSQIPGLIAEFLLLDAEYLRSTLLDLGLGLLFSLLGTFSVLKEVRQESAVSQVQWIDVEPAP